MKIAIATVGMLASVASATASYHHRRLHFPRNNGTEPLTTQAAAPLSTGAPDVMTTDIVTDKVVTQTLTSGSLTTTTTKTVHSTIRSTIKIGMPTDAPAPDVVNNNQQGDESTGLTTMTRTKTTTNTQTLKLAGDPTNSPNGGGQQNCGAASTVYVTLPASTVYVTPSQAAPTGMPSSSVPYPISNSTGGNAASTGYAVPSGFARLRR